MMLEAGLAAFRYTMTGADTAAAVGGGELPVLATPAGARPGRAGHRGRGAGALEAGGTTVGIRVELDHLAPSPRRTRRRRRPGGAVHRGLASLQGGLLLAKTRKESRPLRIALEAGIGLPALVRTRPVPVEAAERLPGGRHVGGGRTSLAGSPSGCDPARGAVVINRLCPTAAALGPGAGIWAVGQVAGLRSRRRNPTSPARARAALTASSQAKGVAVTSTPGSFGRGVKGERSITS